MSNITFKQTKSIVFQLYSGLNIIHVPMRKICAIKTRVSNSLDIQLIKLTVIEMSILVKKSLYDQFMINKRTGNFKNPSEAKF